MVNHSQICNDMLTFRVNAYLTSIRYSVQKTTPPFRVYPAGRSPTTTQKIGLTSLQIGMFPTILPKKTLLLLFICSFCIWSKCFFHRQGFLYSGEWGGRGVGGIPLFARQKLANSPTWKNSPNRLHHSVHFPSNKGFLGKRVMTFFRG